MTPGPPWARWLTADARAISDVNLRSRRAGRHVDIVYRGAVTAAVHAFLTPGAYLRMATNVPLRSIVDRLLIGVRGAGMTLDLVHGPAWPSRPAAAKRSSRPRSR